MKRTAPTICLWIWKKITYFKDPRNVILLRKDISIADDHATQVMCQREVEEQPVEGFFEFIRGLCQVPRHADTHGGNQRTSNRSRTLTLCLLGLSATLGNEIEENEPRKRAR